MVGGTGMLLDAALSIARTSTEFTMVARTQRSLDRFREALGDSDEPVHTLAADWRKPDAFLDTLRSHVRLNGEPDLLVAWLHDPGLGTLIADAVCDPHHETIFVHICGSTTPSRQSLSAGEAFASHINYRRVILGFVEEHGARRWLTDEEICQGVLKAVATDQLEQVVGELDG